MRIAVTGALGGIGRSLVSTLAHTHEIVGVVRRVPDEHAGAARLVAIDEPDAFVAADCIIHCALDSKAPRRQFTAANSALNARVLEGARNGDCRLFIYLSSWVVYSASEPADGGGYRESQHLEESGLDAYSRLKVASERAVIEACEAAGIDWLILRPTIVCGPGLGWSDGIVDAAARWALPAIRGRIINAIHADDLSLMVGRLIERGVANQILNFGGADLASEDYFAEVGRLAGRRPRHLPTGLMRLVGGMLPSTMWFMAKPRTVNLDRLEQLAGPVPRRSVECYFGRWAGTRQADTLDALKAAARSHHEFRTHARDYRAWFVADKLHGRLSIAGYSGVVSATEDTVTVKAGTRLDLIVDHLEGLGRTLPTLPEFLGISAAACFFVDVHGSSRDYFSLYELIEAIRYIDDTGEERVSKADPALWAALRQKRSRFILTEVTFRTVPNAVLRNHIVWGNETELQTYLDGRWRDNLSTALQWYPGRRRCLAYNIREATREESLRAGGAFTPFRGLPYYAQRAVLGVRKPVLIDSTHKILGPWRRIYFETWIYRFVVRRGRPFAWNMEMLFTLEDGRKVIEAFRRQIASGEIGYGRSSSIGIRFSHDRKTDLDYVWIETQGNGAFLGRIASLACETATNGVRFHGGKTIPAIVSALNPRDPVAA